MSTYKEAYTDTHTYNMIHSSTHGAVGAQGLADFVVLLLPVHVFDVPCSTFLLWLMELELMGVVSCIFFR